MLRSFKFVAPNIRPPALQWLASGEEGEAPGNGADTGAVRRKETLRSAALLGYDSVHFLGYRDSETAGSAANSAPGAFAAAPVGEAARRLTPLLVGASLLTTCDPRWDLRASRSRPGPSRGRRRGRHGQYRCRVGGDR
jgi:hypothetical protein